MRLRFRPQSWDLGLQARILAFRLGFGPPGWDLGLKTGIWASRQEWGAGVEKKEEKEEKEKISHNYGKNKKDSDFQYTATSPFFGIAGSSFRW